MDTLKQIEDRLYGTDMALPAAGAVVLTSSGDWPVVTGRRNLQGAHRRRAVTRQGEMLHRDLYGGSLSSHIENVDNDVTRSLLKSNIETNALRDDRVGRVDVVVSNPQDVEPWKVLIDMVVTPRGGEQQVGNSFTLDV